MSRIAVELWFTTLTIQSFGVIFTNTFSRGHVTHAARLVAVVVTVAAAAPLTGCRIAVTAGLTRLTKLSLSPVLTFITSSHALLAC